MGRSNRLRRELLGSAAVLMLSAAPVYADQLDDLQVRVNLIRERINLLQQESTTDDAALSSQAAPADAAVGGDFPGSWKLPGSNTSMAIHGYVKADFIYDFDQTLGDSLNVFNIMPKNSKALVNGEVVDRGGFFRFHARQSRLSFETRTPSDYGMLRTYIETDFFGGSTGPGEIGGLASGGFGNAFVTNSYILRLRRAFATLGHFEFGQDWSNFQDIDTAPETLDFAGPVGQVFIRQPQVRYTNEMGHFTFSASAENPQSDYTTSTGVVAGTYGNPAAGAEASETMPDLTAMIRWDDAWGMVRATGLIRRIGLNSGIVIAGIKREAYALSGGGEASGFFNLNTLSPWFGKDQVGAVFVMGSGLGRYLFFGGGEFDAAAIRNLTTSPSVETELQKSGYVWIRHFWTDQLRSNLVFGIESNFWSHVVPVTTAQSDRLESIHANLIWSPVNQVNIGLELMYGDKEFRPGVAPIGTSRENSIERLQASMQVKF